MRSRSLAIVAALTFTSLAVALAVVRSGGPTAGGAVTTPRPTPEAVVASPAPVPPERLRDIFRFADDARPPVPAPPPSVERDVGAAEPALPAPGPRLVGLVRRSGRLLAALAVDGEVVLAGAGDPAGDVTVLSVDEESARIRRADGSESTLVLP